MKNQESIFKKPLYWLITVNIVALMVRAIYATNIDEFNMLLIPPIVIIFVLPWLFFTIKKIIGLPMKTNNDIKISVKESFEDKIFRWFLIIAIIIVFFCFDLLYFYMVNGWI